MNSLRILIAGWPKCGKTTLAASLGITPIYTTDALKESHGWREASEEASFWLDRAGPWVIEGVAVPRAIRKWLMRDSEGKPCDILYYLSEPFEELTRGQATMGKGCDTVMADIQDELVSRGVEISWTVGKPSSDETPKASGNTEMRSAS